jgi:hypothetical protein
VPSVTPECSLADGISVFSRLQAVLVDELVDAALLVCDLPHGSFEAEAHALFPGLGLPLFGVRHAGESPEFRMG